jgi:predicted TIM-barrel fold metal-dependent hydrolase
MSVPVVDAHHHIWRQRDVAWLNGPMEPRIFGDYSAIRRDYEIEEFIADVTPYGVTRSVYIQCNWPGGGAEAEARYVYEAAERSGWPLGFVGYADLLAPDARHKLERLSAYPFTRGIRMQLHWHENPLYRFASVPNLMHDDKFCQNLALLSDYDWVFELQVFQSQMDDAARLARDFPAITFVLQHCGMPHDDGEGSMSEWRAGMEKLGACTNVVAKLSGLGTFLNKNDPTHIARIARSTVEIFGSNRCLYGSNFPIEKLWTDYGPLIAAFQSAFDDFSEVDQSNIFAKTAERVYRLA